MRNTISIFYLLILSFFMTGVSSCARSGSARDVDSLSRLTRYVNTHGDSFTDADWDDVFSRYERIVANQQRSRRMTPQQAREFGIAQGEFLGACANYGAVYYAKEIEQQLEQTAGVVRGASSNIDREKMEEAGRSVYSGLESLGRELENAANVLEEEFSDRK